MGRGEGRADDNPDTIRKRFKVYQDTTMPVIRQYEELGKLKHVIADRTPDAVFGDVSAIIEAIEGAAPPPLCAMRPRAQHSQGKECDQQHAPVGPCDSHSTHSRSAGARHRHNWSAMLPL